MPLVSLCVGHCMSFPPYSNILDMTGEMVLHIKGRTLPLPANIYTKVEVTESDKHASLIWQETKVL